MLDPSAPIDRRTGIPVRVQVHDLLRDAIIRLELKPGQQLSENELGRRFGVSRTPVREALDRLAAARLVEIIPQTGSFVSRISARKVFDGLFLREALESAMVRSATALAQGDDIDRLRENLRRQELARDSSDSEDFYHLDERFHQEICDLSGHGALWEFIERAKAYHNRLHWLYHETVKGRVTAEMSRILDEHTAIVDAMASGDEAAAEARMRDHLRQITMVADFNLLRSKRPACFED